MKQYLLPLIATGILLAATSLRLAATVGADIPWTTTEAEAMRTTGTVLGPTYGPHQVETESSGQRCVRLDRAGDHVEFDVGAPFDSLVIRYNLPDAPAGGGTVSTLDLLINGQPVRRLTLSSRNAWLYGNYPFSNDPAQGKPRNFYDELRLKGLTLQPGDVVRLQKTTDDGLPCVLDLVDLELIPAPLARPAASLSLADFGADPRGESDATAALRAGVATAAQTSAILWVPAGDYLLTGDIIVPAGVTIQGAGMWHTTFVGNAELYPQADRRVRFKLAGHHVRVADFAIFGQLNYRNDDEPNDGLIGANATDSEIARIWVEHTKAGAWIYNGVRLRLEGCRFRNLIADGVNLCVSTSETIVENCTARGTGDDCFAIWPTATDQCYDGQGAPTGYNVIRRCTGSLPFLANGGALYGGDSNRLEECLFTDISTGCGILISTTFSTADPVRKIDHNFSGTTVVRNNLLIRCGGYDHVWAWRGSVQLCLDRNGIAGLTISALTIRDSLSSGLTIVTSSRTGDVRPLAQARLTDLKISGSGLGGAPHHDLWIHPGVTGSLTLHQSPLVAPHNESLGFQIISQAK